MRAADTLAIYHTCTPVRASSQCKLISDWLVFAQAKRVCASLRKSYLGVEGTRKACAAFWLVRALLVADEPYRCDNGRNVLGITCVASAISGVSNWPSKSHSMIPRYIQNYHDMHLIMAAG